MISRLQSCGVWLAAVALLSAAVPCLAQSDADFLAARAAFDKGDRVLLAGLSRKLNGHILLPYVEYWRLKLAIDDASPDAVRDFLARYPDTPLAEKLRVDWLKSLARKADWNRFALDYPPPSGEDVELACYGIQYRRQRDGDAVLADAKPLWFSGQTTPDACEPLFAVLIGHGDLTAADRVARFRLASEAGNVKLAQAIAADVPGKERIVGREFLPNRDFQRALDGGAFAFSTGAGREVALYTLERVARSDASAARPAWVKWRDKLPEAERKYGNARLAYHAARQLNASANDWFREAGDAPLAPEMQAWRARAALRALAWSDVLAAIDGMTESQRNEAAWRYWKGRALVAKGRGVEAKPLFETLAAETHYYGVLAAESLGRRFEPPKSEPLLSTMDALNTFGAQPAVQRVVKLTHLDLKPEARREWLFVVRGQSDETLLLAADYARRVALYDRAVNTAERTTARHDYSLRYLAPFRTEFDAASRNQDVDVALLYGIARQESRFSPDIVSSAGAVGLMQLMPGTAKWVANQLGRKDYRAAAIGDVELNTNFGAYYFKYWLERLDRMPALAAAAYNAGPGRAQAWRPPAALEGAIWVETIPFNETRDYVKKVLANSMFYAQAFGGSPQSLTARLGQVAPRGGSVADPITASAP
ncbi:MAG: transglycosylase SLT domain-containing protein [Betaproteobacteria bacterium]